MKARKAEIEISGTTVTLHEDGTWECDVEFYKILCETGSILVGRSKEYEPDHLAREARLVAELIGGEVVSITKQPYDEKAVY